MIATKLQIKKNDKSTNFIDKQTFRWH